MSKAQKQLDEYLKTVKVSGIIKMTDTDTGEVSFDELYDINDIDLDELCRMVDRKV